jgi:hypothetical protein
MMVQAVLTQKKKRGPPATGKGTLVGVRLQPAPLDALDAYIAAQRDPASRPEAIRKIVTRFLRSKGYLGK